MGQYKFLKKKGLEKLDSFESRINEEATRGWKVVNFALDSGGVMVLMERQK